MKQSLFDKLTTRLTSELRILQELGTPITTKLIAETLEGVTSGLRGNPAFEITASDEKRLLFQVGQAFNVRVGEQAILLRNPDLPRWFDSKKASLNFRHWNAYREMLLARGRSESIVDANEKVIDDVLDYSGDPTTPGSWSRKGLVMGNVQSGKTQNYIGLINKAIDCGYKTIILLGGHLNDLRRQTQERVDEGVLGQQSRHLTVANSRKPTPIGIAEYLDEVSISTGTTTVGDFSKSFANKLGVRLTGEDPFIFVIKKHVGVMERLHNWISDFHYLDSEAGKKLKGPLLLIDDEADYASINTKHHKEEVTRTNEYIRKILSLFDRNTYIGYTATPFANIFIDPDESHYSEKDGLFPSDFMIKIPVPDNYHGQDFFFRPEQDDSETIDNPDINEGAFPELQPTVTISDHAPVYELKGDDYIGEIPESLRDAIRAFIIVVAIRLIRGDTASHNTMLVNISHLKIHQNRLELLIEDYRRVVEEALQSFGSLDSRQRRKSTVLTALENTFNHRFSTDEDYDAIYPMLLDAAGRIKVWAINQSTKTDERSLDYSIHKDNGLSVIVIGGHKLSRGLTLEGLSISYFARNSKAYDTLMQMCRWFGYRQGYEDLCKVYLPQESIDWYSFIASAIRELYQELERMAKRQQRPSEFGLKVREHPGAMMITARNKIGWGESEVRSQDLWGQVQRRFRFHRDKEINKRNIDYADRFIQKLKLSRCDGQLLETDARGSLRLLDVDYEDIISFIETVDLPEDDIGNSALVKHLESMSAEGLGKPRVVVFNSASFSRPPWLEYVSRQEQEFMSAEYVFADEKFRLPKRKMNDDGKYYKVRSVHLGNPDDEKLFLNENERQVVKAECEAVGKTPVSFDYICSNGRDYPGLLIYLFAVAVPQSTKADNPEEYRLAHGLSPTLGYTVSLPRSENLKGKSNDDIRRIIKETKHSYLVGKVYEKLQELSAYEEYEDE